MTPLRSPHPPPLIVVMGVCGSGKTTVGAALATRLGLPFRDGDDLHPAANVARMRAGVPLTDADRLPWLDALGSWLAARTGIGAVTSCSALRRSYREVLRGHAPGVWFAHLHGDRATIAARLAARHDHFMPAALLDSQLATLEPLGPGETGPTLDVTRPVDELVAACAAPFTPAAFTPAAFTPAAFTPAGSRPAPPRPTVEV